MNTVSTPLVSIVAITYNSSRYVLDTLESIKKQTYQNIELIISDDGSTDETIDICKKWLSENEKRFVSTRLILSDFNTGIPANCNRGWEATQGPWIKLIAGDDILFKDCIQKNIKYVSQNPFIEILYSDAVKIDEKGNYLLNQKNFYNEKEDKWRKYIFKQESTKQLKLFVREPVYLTPSIFLNKTLLKKVNGFDEKLRIFEDIVFVIKVLSTGSKLYYSPIPTVGYRIHNESISRKKDKIKEQKSLEELAFIYNNYRKQYLSIFNIIDMCVRYEAWLQFKYAFRYKLKGARFLQYLNLLHIFKWQLYKL